MIRKKILVSACLLGEPVRYDRQIIPNCPKALKQWESLGLVIPVCPEVFGGLSVPRPPAEIQIGDGKDIIDGNAQVIDINGQDLTNAFLKGAQAALHLAHDNDIQIAVLKARSPSCGSKMIHDGNFGGRLKAGQGVTAALLERGGIQVFNEEEIDQAGCLIDE